MINQVLVAIILTVLLLVVLWDIINRWRGWNVIIVVKRKIPAKC